VMPVLTAAHTSMDGPIGGFGARWTVLPAAHACRDKERRDLWESTTGEAVSS
jgi:hypothetical protein